MKTKTILMTGCTTLAAGAASAHPGHGALEGLFAHGFAEAGMIGVVMIGLGGLFAIWLGVRGRARSRDAEG